MNPLLEKTYFDVSDELIPKSGYIFTKEELIDLLRDANKNGARFLGAYFDEFLESKGLK